MVLDQVANFLKVVVSTGYSASDTSIVLSSGEGAKLPDPSGANYNLVWWNNTDYSSPGDDPNVEIVRVSAKSTDTITVTRGRENITATTKNTADKSYAMILSFTKKSYDDIKAVIDVTTGTNTGDNTLAATITVVDSTSATTWPAIFDSATGNLAIKTDAGLTYDATAANLSTTTFTGALTGHASLDLPLTGGSLSAALAITSADAANAVALTVTQQDTNTSNALNIVNAGKGDSEFITQTGNGVALHIDNNGTANSITVEGTSATDFTVAKSGNVNIGGALTLGTDLAVTEGGTGASTAGAAKTNLGIVTGYTLTVFNSAAGSPGDSLTYYIAQNNTLTEVQGLGRIYVPFAGTLKKIYGIFSQSAGTNEASTLSIYINATTTVQITNALALDAAQVAFSKTDMAQAVSAGDYIELKWDTPAWATNPTTVRMSATIWIEN